MKKLLTVLFAVLMLTACGSSNDDTNDNAATELKGAAEIATEKGSVNTEVTLVDGKITAIAIDEVEGENTKKTLGADYGMKAASSIEKELNEQIAHLENALIGTGGTIALTEEGKAASEDIISGCTINLSVIAQSVSEAVANAK